MSLDPLYVLLGEVSAQVLCPFFNWIVCLPGMELCEFFIYFGDQTLVWGTMGKYIFPYGWFSFILMLFSLAMQKLFILMSSHLFILSFMSLALGDMSVRMLLRGMSEIFLPCFPRGLLWCYHLYLSLIHLEFIFVYGVSWWSSFIFLHIAVLKQQ